jgi:hypothetical protein
MCQFTDRFYSAVRTLAGDGAVKQRLISAYKNNLEALPGEEIPQSIRDKFERLRVALHGAEPIGKECAVVATVRKMSAAEASSFASDIVAMFSELVRAKSTGERISIVKPAERQEQLPNLPAHVSLN